MCVRELDAVRGNGLTDGLWIDEGCGDEVEAGIQVLLAARSQTDQQHYLHDTGHLKDMSCNEYKPSKLHKVSKARLQFVRAVLSLPGLGASQHL